MRILLVEDNAGDARLFAELLRDVPGRPFELTTAGTLAGAQSLVAGHDVIFLDLSLPDAHGLTTLTHMVQLARNLPIVVLTGNDDDRIAVDAMKAGAQDYLRKSEITPSLIARTARYAVERKLAEENARKLAHADEAARRARFISSLTTAITSSFDLDVTLSELGRLIVPTLGDYCAIDLVREDGRVDRVALASADPEQLATLHELYKYVPGTTHPKSPVAKAVASRETLLIAPFNPEEFAPDTAYAEICRKLQPRAMLITPLIARDRVVGAITYALGPSQRVFDAELRTLAEEVAERVALGIDNAFLYAAAQRAIRGRDELLAVVSHDLRNPLSIVALALQSLESSPESLAKVLPRAKRGTDRMLRLVEDLLDLARIEAGAMKVESHLIDLTTVLEDAYEQHRALAADKRITLVREYPHDLEAVADRHRLSQALANLVGNSIKFTPAGGTIKIGAQPQGERVVLSVADTGPGIHPEHLAHIFDRFWQPQRRRDGVGLGLAIVKGIIDAHGGTIRVESTVGVGTTISVGLARTQGRADGGSVATG